MKKTINTLITVFLFAFLAISCSFGPSVDQKDISNLHNTPGYNGVYTIIQKVLENMPKSILENKTIKNKSIPNSIMQIDYKLIKIMKYNKSDLFDAGIIYIMNIKKVAIKSSSMDDRINKILKWAEIYMNQLKYDDTTRRKNMLDFTQENRSKLDQEETDYYTDQFLTFQNTIRPWSSYLLFNYSGGIFASKWDEGFRAFLQNNYQIELTDVIGSDSEQQKIAKKRVSAIMSNMNTSEKINMVCRMHQEELKALQDLSRRMEEGRTEKKIEKVMLQDVNPNMVSAVEEEISQLDNTIMDINGKIKEIQNINQNINTFVPSFELALFSFPR